MSSSLFGLAYGSGMDGKYLRMASGAIENVVCQAVHLGMATFASVLAEGVWKGSYLLERPKDATF
jgi:hypothetical protein